MFSLIHEINTAADFDHGAKVDLLTTERDAQHNGTKCTEKVVGDARKQENPTETGQYLLQSCPRGLVRLTRDTAESWQATLLALR